MRHSVFVKRWAGQFVIIIHEVEFKADATAATHEQMHHIHIHTYPYPCPNAVIGWWMFVRNFLSVFVIVFVASVVVFTRCLVSFAWNFGVIVRSF